MLTGTQVGREADGRCEAGRRLARVGVTSLLLGSVSDAAVPHSRGPVVVIPAAVQDRRPAAPC
jgi:nucleotide-binding universal stress UspA family protein